MSADDEEKKMIKKELFMFYELFSFRTLFVKICSLLMELGVSFVTRRASQIKFNIVLQFNMRMYRKSSYRKKNSAEGCDDGKLVF